jgi:NAD(P)-dependent dehydrogenase (short-subunit alcohol dehydrogenase family)
MTFSIDLTGQRALVTGAGQGVGRELARTLGLAGAYVHVNDVVAERSDAVVAEIRSEGGSAESAPFDVTDFDAVQSQMDSDVDILVNNAGNAGTQAWEFAPFAETIPEDWDRYLQVNLLGVMNCTRAALPGMISRQHGRVVTIISDAARFGDANMAPYVAAKAGAAGFTRAVAREVGRYGITVNNVALGSVRTEPSGTDRERDQRILRSYIIRRFGRPEDVAPLVALLASPLSSWITGQTFPVNGGYTVNL